MAQNKKRIKKWLRILTLVLALLILAAVTVSHGAGEEDKVDAGVVAESVDAGETGDGAIQLDTEQPLVVPEEETQQNEEHGTAQEAGGADEASEGNEEYLEEQQSVETEAEAKVQPEQHEEQADGQEDSVEEEGQPDTEQSQSQSIQPLNAYGYTVLPDGASAVVTDFLQLKDAIEKDNGIVNVYLGADIELLQNRTVIPASKTVFTLSGTDPRTGIQYTITEHKTTGLANIVVPSGNKATRTVTMEDMTIVNQGDYYGLIGIEDIGGGVDMIARNISFAGRQFAYNPYGRLIFEGDNSITINQVTSGGVGEEVAEVLNVVVRGSLTVNFNSTFHVFRMNTGAGTFTVEGSLVLNASRIASGNGVIQSLTGASAVGMYVRAGASVDITANNRLASGILSELVVEDGAVFRFEKTGTAAYPAINLRQRLSVGTGAVFYASQSAASYLIQFSEVPSAMAGGVMEFNSPEKVTLQNIGGARMVYGTKTEEFTVTTQYLDYWSSGQDLAADAAYSFSKKDVPGGEDITIRMTHKAGVPVGIVSNNADITADKLKLDATAKQVVLGQESKATLKFTAQLEETGDAVAGFAMEDQLAEKWVETVVWPQEVPGYIATGYSVDGGDVQQLQNGQAKLIPQENEVKIVFYYAEPVLEVSVPVKMMFAAYENNGGEITSREYEFRNGSAFDVDVSLVGVSGMEGTENMGLRTREEAQQIGGLWLELAPRDTSRFNAVDFATATSGPQYIGRLGDDGDAQNRTMEYTLGGWHYGSFGTEAAWPAWQVEFLFEMGK
ncbi:hypothetical protein LJC56_06685 [Christensenellaceae bacterium OttesenSCG-928-K19]|nr:hypothetical protein [Christensenellaceae bacterium OttesenSCG-928-K19]